MKPSRGGLPGTWALRANTAQGPKAASVSQSRLQPGPEDRETYGDVFCGALAGQSYLRQGEMVDKSKPLSPICCSTSTLGLFMRTSPPTRSWRLPMASNDDD